MKSETPFEHISDKHCRIGLYDRWRLRTQHINGRDHVLCATEEESYRKRCIKYGQNYTIDQNKNTQPAIRVIKVMSLRMVLYIFNRGLFYQFKICSINLMLTSFRYSVIV